MRRFARAPSAVSTQGNGMRRSRFGLVCLCALGVAAFLGSSEPSAAAQACPNEEFRNGPSAKLPDCRAYEMVSPPEKEGFEPIVDPFLKSLDFTPIAAENGQSAAFTSYAGFGELEGVGVVNAFLSRRGASDWSTAGISPPIGPYPSLSRAHNELFTQDLEKMAVLGAWEPPLTLDASAGTSNLYLRDNSSTSYRLLSVGAAAGLTEVFFYAVGISTDASHVVFNSPSALTGCAAGSLCDWSAATGALSQIGGAGATLAAKNPRRPVSADGSRVFFKGGGCGLCVRIDAATTHVIGAGTGAFEAASSDGSVAYVTDGEDLERYGVSPGGVSPPLLLAEEVQGVLGASADGSRVYFVSDEGAEDSLYMWTDDGTPEGEITFIAGPVTLGSNWAGNLGSLSSRVTPDGMHLAFTADESLTGFPDNGTSQAYLYSAATGALVCASCVIAEPESGAFIEGGQNDIARLSRNLSDDGGHLFFNTDEALVPQDTNNLTDVYEYDAANGQVALISPGTGGENVKFNDASSSGNDAFFGTREKLVGSDKDGLLDVYDARVGGGLTAQNPPAPAAPCSGEACRSGATPIPTQPNIASPGFAGKGNLASKRNCSKLRREARRLSQRAKRLRKNAKQAKRNGKPGLGQEAQAQGHPPGKAGEDQEQEREAL